MVTGQIKQHNRMHDLGMLGKPIDAPKNEIFLRPHWKYAIKINGTCRSIHYYDDFKISAPILIEFTLTYSSCVEHPDQILFIAVSSHLDLRIYGGNASDSFIHIPGPYVTTYLSINYQFTDWYRHIFGKNIDTVRLP